MKLIMENWRTYVENAQHYDCGKLYILENKKMTPVSFNEKLNMITESNEEIDSFLEQWDQSADYVLSLNRIDEGVMDLVSQAAAVLGNLAGKSWEVVKSVTSKVLAFIEKFKEDNPKIYAAIKWASIAILSIAALYVIANVTEMTAVKSAIESLAQFQWPDTTISELVHDLAGQQTVDALRTLKDELFNRVGDIGMQLKSSPNGVISDLGGQILDAVPADSAVEASHDWWAAAMEGAQ